MKGMFFSYISMNCAFRGSIICKCPVDVTVFTIDKKGCNIGIETLRTINHVGYNSGTWK